MLNKQATRFLNRSNVKKLLSNKVLTDFHIVRLNRLFAINTCKQLENMHATIAKFILYDLNNYEGRLRRLKGIPGTTPFTQLLRYGKAASGNICSDQTERKTKHFQNKTEYWIALGYTNEQAIIKVKKVQLKRNATAVEKMTGTSMYSCRSISFWVNKGLSDIDAAAKVKEIQTTNGLDYYIKKYGNITGTQQFNERISQWQAALDNKSDSEKELISLKKSPSINGRIARGDTLEDATIGYLDFCKKMKSKPNQSWSKISQELFDRLDEKASGTTFYQTKNYEYNVENYRVDFYHKESKTVVEFYGDFFHRNPIIFEATHYSMGYTSAEKWESDKIRIDEIKASKLVNQVIIVWEIDFRSDPTSIVDYILTKLEK